MALTSAQKQFCEEYILNGYNAIAAYRKAYPTGGANPQATYPYKLLKKPDVQEYIKNRREEIFDSLQIDQMRVMSEIASIAFAEKGDQIYTTSNKVKALEILCKVMGLQITKTENKDIIEVSLLDEEDKSDD